MLRRITVLLVAGGAHDVGGDDGVDSWLSLRTE